MDTFVIEERRAVALDTVRSGDDGMAARERVGHPGAGTVGSGGGDEHAGGRGEESGLGGVLDVAEPGLTGVVSGEVVLVEEVGVDGGAEAAGGPDLLVLQ